MAVRDVRARERDELIATLRDVGPDAPTLCDRWTAGDVGAHVAMSEHALGLPMLVANGVRHVLPARITRRAIASMQATGDRLIERVQARGWDHVLRRLAAGPPRLHRVGSLTHVRLVEEWIHHEDVRRGAGLPWREAPAALSDALWRAGVTVAGFREFRAGREAIEIDAGDGRRFTIGADAPRVRVAGAPGEVLLFLAGRGDAAHVDVTGDAELIGALRSRLTV